jgi:hypothetical protein
MKLFEHFSLENKTDEDEIGKEEENKSPQKERASLAKKFILENGQIIVEKLIFSIIQAPPSNIIEFIIEVFQSAMEAFPILSIEWIEHGIQQVKTESSLTLNLSRFLLIA